MCMGSHAFGRRKSQIVFALRIAIDVEETVEKPSSQVIPWSTADTLNLNETFI